MKLTFLGNTRYSLIGAKIIYQAYSLSLVVTKPGSPVAQWSRENSIPLYESSSDSKGLIQKVKKTEPDFLIAEDFGLILPKEILEIPKYAPLNIHHSLLPEYRGPAPAPAAILNGEKISGVTIIRMIEEVDAGDILAQEEYTLTPDETTDSLLTQLNSQGAKLLVMVLDTYSEIKPTPQDSKKATFTKKFTKKDGYFDISRPPEPDELDRKIRAFHPWPNVWTRWNGKIVKFYPGDLIQMEGRKKLKLEDFLRGYPDFPLKQI